MLLWYIDPGTGFSIFSAGAWIFALLIGFFGFFGIFFKKIFGFFKKHIKLLIILILLALITAGIIIGVNMKNKEVAFNKRIIILGYDGLSPEIIDTLLKENKLPNFAKLKAVGSYQRLSTTNPSQSPVAWSGFATGKNPGKNGVYDFIVRDPKTYALSLSLTNFKAGKAQRVIQEKCFWQYVSEKNVPVTIINCPVTFPPDKVHGKMLSGMGVPDILGTEGTFTFYTSEPLDKEKDIGGKVFQVRKSNLMLMRLIGPRVATPSKEAKNVEVPFKAILEENKDSVAIEYQGNKFTLKTGEWSSWQEVTFNLGFFKKAKGICKFYLVETSPEFKL
ncbi:MAG: alkaline phosphatase family protein, partial [Candidatus Omnitrophica bacterium]|nr:alkaline phosphatase family protein [Candidatus Omnitrophota bacterium]